MIDNEQTESATIVDQSAGISVPGEEIQQSVPRDDSGDVETRARAQGWVPKDEFRGPAEKWRDADEFVRKGEEELPILRERSRTLSKTVDELQRKFSQAETERKAELARLERMSSVALQKQREQLEANYKFAMRQAVEAGDVARFEQLDGDRNTAIKAFDEHVTPVAKPQQQNHPEHEVATVQTWTQQNPWFTADPELNAVAQAHHMRLNREKPGLSLNENLAEVTKYVRQRYADKFTPTIVTGAVEGGGQRMASASKAKGAGTLTSEERRVGEKFVKEGLFKDLNEYAKELYADA